jgi:hypothetical protein
MLATVNQRLCRTKGHLRAPWRDRLPVSYWRKRMMVGVKRVAAYQSEMSTKLKRRSAWPKFLNVGVYAITDL